MNYIQDAELIELVKKRSDSQALKELETRHSGICHQMIKRYYHNLIDLGINPEDVIADKLSVIYKSVLNFDPNKNVKFSTWLWNQMRYHCLNCMNKNNKFINLDQESIKYIIENNQKNNLNLENSNKEQTTFCFSLLDQIKDKRIKRIFKMRYFDNKKLTSWAKIAKKLDLSTQTVINLHNKTKRILKIKLTSDNNTDII
jgi:RNA polymerase sigma factor (sigma-70 family)